MPTNVEFWVTLLAAIGGGAFLRESIVGIYKWLTGSQERERTALQTALRQTDSEAAYRRVLQEALSETRRILIDKGFAEDLPPYPTRPDITKEEEHD